MDYEKITADDVRKFTKPTAGFLCPQSANIYGIQFVQFKIRNVDNNQVLFEVAKPENDWGKPIPEEMRTVRYHFGPNFFLLNHIGTTLQFRVRQKAAKNFIMIERHYFREKLLKSYEFDVPFCMPNSVNDMEAIYELPQFSEQEKKEMIDSPWQTQSDSFYFVDGKLIMHNKAKYNYQPFDN